MGTGGCDPQEQGADKQNNEWSSTVNRADEGPDIRLCRALLCEQKAALPGTWEQRAVGCKDHAERDRHERRKTG